MDYLLVIPLINESQISLDQLLIILGSDAQKSLCTMNLNRLSVVTEKEFPFSRHFYVRTIKTPHRKELTCASCSVMIEVITAFLGTLPFLRTLSLLSCCAKQVNSSLRSIFVGVEGQLDLCCESIFYQILTHRLFIL